MKYKNKIALSLIVLIIALSISYAVDAYESMCNIKDKVIRLHVIANSNTLEDQQLKYKVRDNVIKEFDKEFELVSTKDKSEDIIINKINDIRKQVEQTILNEGYNYHVDVYYGNYKFPRKQYEEIVLPEGNYDAVRIEIGEAVGNNWWCVMFPPLCFVNFGNDESAEPVFDIDTEKKLQEVLTAEEIQAIKTKRGLNDIKLKSKIFEFIEKGRVINTGVYTNDLCKTYAVSTRVLLKDDSEEQGIIEIKNKLVDLGYLEGEVNSIYGIETLRAVKKFQKDNNLEQSGIVDLNVLQRLNLSLEKNNKNNISYSFNIEDIIGSEIELMAKVVYLEAKDEPYEGKVAVASIILNRLKDTKFPDTIPEVVYEKGAFLSIGAKDINTKIDEESYKAVYDAINGWDQSNNSLYYWNPSKSSSRWILSRTAETKIGNHWFGN